MSVRHAYDSMQRWLTLPLIASRPMREQQGVVVSFVGIDRLVKPDGVVYEGDPSLGLFRW